MEVRCVMSERLLERAINIFTKDDKHKFVQHSLRVFVTSINCLMSGVEIGKEINSIGEKILKDLCKEVRDFMGRAVYLMDSWCAKVLPDPSRVVQYRHHETKMNSTHELQVHFLFTLIEVVCIFVVPFTVSK